MIVVEVVVVAGSEEHLIGVVVKEFNIVVVLVVVVIIINAGSKEYLIGVALMQQVPCYSTQSCIRREKR